ncbi:MAG: hypothetical protein QM726_19330 [Chitinophagaceae bacterium]
MKTLLLFFFASFLLVAFIQKNNNITVSLTERNKAIARTARYAIRCSPLLSSINFEDSAAIPLLEGWGPYRMPVTVSNDSAKIYFEQGINMYYGFHVIEALASFEKAVKLDTAFAMGYWGKALSYGPNINDYGYSASPDALTAVAKAVAHSANNTPVEKALIAAMQVRYSADSTRSRTALNQLYADAMKKVSMDFNQSVDAAALYVDALMVQHPWDLYYKNYQPKAWTAEIVNTLEKILQQHPRHPGAAHYYIHAVEASAHPEKGLTVSNILPGLMPGVAHLVHMPSHIYIRSGYYDIGEKVNDDAVKGYYNYLSKFPAVVNNSPLYLIHNLHMQATCANMDGRYKQSMKVAIDCSHSFDSTMQDVSEYFGGFVQYVYMTPLLTQIRFGKWDDLLKTEQPPAVHIYANLLWHYGAGLAYARKHDFENAAKELVIINKEMDSSVQLKSPAPSYANPAIAGAEVAAKILEGTIAEEKGDYNKSIGILQHAVIMEDSMVYNEPKDWVHPVRQYLGNVLCKAKKYDAAEKVYKEDLVINPNNGWSLTGLTTALSAQGKKEEAAKAKEQAAKAFAKADGPITHSVF